MRSFPFQASRYVLSLLAGTVTASAAAGGGPAPAALPTLRIAPGTSVVEGSAGTKLMEFPVTLSAPSGSAVSVAYATADGTATAGSDYAATSGRLTIPAGQTAGVVRVPVIGDTRRESDEVMSLKLSAPSGATLGSTGVAGIGIFLNDDDYQWGSAQPMNYPQTSANESLGLGLDDAGNALVLWQQDNTPYATGEHRGVMARRYLAGQGWQPATMIAGPAYRETVGNYVNDAMAVAGTGAGLAAWGAVNGNGVAAAGFDPAGGWSPAQLISGGDTGNTYKFPKAALGRGGQGAVAWTGANPTVVAYDRRTGFGAPQALTDQGGTLVNVAVDDAGNRTLWWQASRVDRLRYGAELLSRQLSPAGTLGSVEAVSGGPTDLSSLGSGGIAYASGAMGRDGVAYAAWIGASVQQGTAGRATVFVTRRDPGGRWQTPTALGEIAYPLLGLTWGLGNTTLHLAASASGALVTWTSDASSSVTQYSIVSPGGPWSRPASLLADGTAIQPTIALADNGEALAVFQYYGATPNAPFQLNAIRYRPGQGWSGREVVKTQHYLRPTSALAMTPDGRGMAVYTGTDDTSSHEDYSSAGAWAVGGTRFE